MDLKRCLILWFLINACKATKSASDHETDATKHVSVNGIMNVIRQKNEGKYFSSKDLTPIRLSRRSTEQPNVRTRREVMTLVDAISAYAEKLENVTNGVEFLVQYAKAEQIGYTDIMKKMESMTRLFSSMFVILADVTFSTSPRIKKYPEDIVNISNNFRKEIKSRQDTAVFDENLLSVLNWYYLKFHSCLELRDAGFKGNDVYTIQMLDKNKLLKVSCDQETDGGGWLVIQRRQDGSEDFLRPWTDYQQGFGDVSGEFWLGNDYLHELTKTSQELRIDITDFDGNTAYARYSTFVIRPSSEYYKVTVGGYSGTAGDSMALDNGGKFYTIDSGNSCVDSYKGAWWRDNCFYGNLNGIYFNTATDDMTSISWYTWKNKYEALKRTEVKIRPLI